MELIGIFIVHYIFAFMGASFRYLFINPFRYLIFGKSKSFMNIWNGGDKYQGIENDVTNAILGFAIFIIVANFLV